MRFEEFNIAKPTTDELVGAERKQENALRSARTTAQPRRCTSAQRGIGQLTPLLATDYSEGRCGCFPFGCSGGDADGERCDVEPAPPLPLPLADALPVLSGVTVPLVVADCARLCVSALRLAMSSELLLRRILSCLDRSTRPPCHDDRSTFSLPSSRCRDAVVSPM